MDVTEAAQTGAASPGGPDGPDRPGGTDEAEPVPPGAPAGRPLSVAVIGSGPAGVYVVDQLLRAEPAGGVRVDVLERLPAPTGLVRYGVSPDHPDIKSIGATLLGVLSHDGVRLLGNVRVGERPGEVPVEALLRHHDAVVVATGSSADAPLDVPGVDLPGCVGASEVVAWYGGHPDGARTWDLSGPAMAVLGAGNVALDVARVLARPARDLHGSDVPHAVYEALESSALTDVHVFGRRGADAVRFTAHELDEIGALDGVDVVLDPAELELDEEAAAAVEADRGRRQVLQALHRLAGREPTGAPRRLHLHLHAAPVAVLGDDRVEGLRTEATTTRDGALVGTGETTDWPVSSVVRAVGYTGRALPGVPFDAARGVVPNDAGRVLDANGAPVPGLYVNGWIKRGPSGLIGASRRDARETVRSLLADAEAGVLGGARTLTPDGLDALLAAEGVEVVDLTGWGRLDAHEAGAGAHVGRSRVKVVDHDAMVAAARASASQDDG